MMPRVIQSSAIVVALVFGRADMASGEPPAWPEEPYVQQLVTRVLPDTSPPWDGREFAQRGTRGATYIAAGVLWRDGALLGDKPEQAYFVRCDRTTMTQNDLDNGRMICQVGVAPSRPAEYVIFRIGQWTADRRA